jgi:hypothetical protein
MRTIKELQAIYDRQKELEQIRPIPDNYLYACSTPDYVIYHCRPDEKRYFVLCFIGEDMLFSFYGQVRSLQYARDMCQEDVNKRALSSVNSL